jgi:Golgi nucleoside diphosphatase
MSWVVLCHVFTSAFNIPFNNITFISKVYLQNHNSNLQLLTIYICILFLDNGTFFSYASITNRFPKCRQFFLDQWNLIDLLDP